MQSFNTTTKVMLWILIVLGGLIGLGLTFDPIGDLTLFGLLPMSDALRDGAVRFMPSTGAFVIGVVLASIYAAVKQSKEVLYTALGIACVFLIISVTEMLLGVVGSLQEPVIQFLIAREIFFLVYTVILFYVSRSE